MNSNLMDRTVADVLRDVLEDEGGTPLVIAPDARTIEALVEVLNEHSPPVRLLADAATLKQVMEDFLVAGRAADHIEAERLEIRVDDEGTNTVLITETAVVALVRGNERVAGLQTDRDEFTRDIGDRFGAVWENAEPYTPRIPSLVRIRETLEAELGTATATDFDTVLSSLETAGGADTAFDEVTVSLLVAARNEDLLYDISKWGEDVGIASKATFSRTKTRMEDSGLIETEKVPIDVGRPRLRLKLATSELRAAAADELLELARSVADT